MRWFVPPPAATAAFSISRSPGVVLRVSRIRAVVPSTASTNRRRERRHAAEALQEVEGAALGDQDPGRRAGDAQHLGAGLVPHALGRETAHLGARVALPEGLLGGVEAEDDAGRLLRDRRHAAGVRGDGRLGGEIAVADVLGERARDQLAQEVRIDGHAGRENMDVDAWLPRPQVRTRHRREADATREALWDVAREVRLDETRTLGRLVRWRIPGTPADVTFRALFAGEPFAVLGEGDGWSVSGLVGRIWTLRRDYPVLDGAEEFRSWDRPGTVRVLIANWVEDAPDGRAALVSESRVAAVDRRAALHLRALWTVVGPFERLIGAEALTLAARRAERRPAPGPRAR